MCFKEAEPSALLHFFSAQCLQKGRGSRDRGFHYMHNLCETPPKGECVVHITRGVTSRFLCLAMQGDRHEREGRQPAKKLYYSYAVENDAAEYDSF